MPAHSPILNLPNILTLIRVAAIPVLVAAFYLPFKGSNMVAAVLFLAAGLTDWLDGYLARKLGQTSPFGAFLDPVADKLIVAVALLMLVQQHATLWLTAPAMVIVCREITVSALREWMAELGMRAKVAVSAIGKIKTVTQMVAITLLLAVQPGYDVGGGMLMTPILWLSYLCLYVAMLLTLWSMFLYLKAAAPQFRRSRPRP
ncbi:CDP-diacylglycerol--glycerol-3-phosphate 3-phosphatidyltransferase [Alloalcanivorax xenomutans]|jgi:CDP-diacylglycerol---glycerol-3-phosphate 3-phosphatidyltransferase|uniref:CDP-diacylglycerol--glycerol-3-phosphate 3-phosphatidyltransferase n=1 Tax=Alloalcanivorax xenomutans TaxID=1094342 RepID=A0A9Q3W5H2_9GAMM|nr:CDP-diacylglycerol--glycerol-3-phosphate 3-phosphatidyltransferase [Alloalcanivorax xenomutans]ERS10948.1 CDP-diacylglycerol--glycerol-3-phosphate 3-phosphatidyltransferase [Alcanivorax sp. PN-3]KYZ88074.1 CDP-diacylglycerol--glycerol-3-phosphate 3-phosphatidyltransferase [Alcanivorax sp. KX64203]MBA4720183.1 CDP-diacylglycerol--glycerol-3-phosphate 3-phosphatidyltransferase [Alcanivorax sp.]ARB45661.1 CDP-diacylglycerol--glycerol-3-phosphate 3-phosphatidyltransferase [Alloalcanivorax xenomu